MARTNLASGSNPASQDTYDTGSIAPGANRLALAFVAHLTADGSPANTPTLQGAGLTWVEVASLTHPANPGRRLTCFRAMAPAPAQGAITIAFGGQPQLRCGWSVFEYDGIDTTGANGAGAVLQPTPLTGAAATASIPLPNALADPARSITVGGVIISLDGEADKAIDPGAGCVEIHEVDLNDPANRGVTLQTEERTGGQQVEWSWNGAENFAAIALEIKAAAVAAPPPDDPEALAKRFEPILRFHPEERFFPSDAKRYLEACALWRAEAPFDQKGAWGDRTAPFPKKPTIEKGNIALLQGEPGTLLKPGDEPEMFREREHFLDLAGWKDATGTLQPDVTQTSQNAYSERDAIATRYNADDAQGGVSKLRDSRFRYHAELFDAERLRRLLATVGAPDLVKVLDAFKNPALLCYYFFYPAHEEALDSTCPNVEAREFAGYGGEWSCMALLLERDDPNGVFRPSHIGITGRRIPPDAGGRSRPQADDSESPGSLFADDARRQVMKVTRFSNADAGNPAPDKIDEHPILFVAKGTHSLYVASGTVEVVYPYEIAPSDCGRFEGPLPTGDGGFPSEFFTNPAIFFSKLIAGAALGLGLIGLAVGIAWIVAEGATLGSGLDVVGVPPLDGSSDEIAPAGAGPTIKPTGLAVPDAGPDPKEWLSRQGEIYDGRRYDFIVDRGNQVWWPKDSGDDGYQGRWGPRVENDPVGRRAGMRFPEFWRTFFLALAKGKADGTL